MPYFSFDSPTTLERTQLWFQGASTDPTRAHFSVVDPDERELVGMAGLLDISARDRKAELYVTIGEARFRRHGLARRATAELLDIGFSELELHRIYLTTFVDNRPAHNLYKSLGFVLEGNLREHVWNSGAFRDVAVYSLLRREWDGVTTNP